MTPSLLLTKLLALKIVPGFFFSTGFLEYLLDRKTETDKAGKELKYELIAELVRSPFSKEVFDKPFHLRLREYEREGPFYVQAQAAVAFEGAD